MNGRPLCVLDDVFSVGASMLPNVKFSVISSTPCEILEEYVYQFVSEIDTEKDPNISFCSPDVYMW